MVIFHSYVSHYQMVICWEFHPVFWILPLDQFADHYPNFMRILQGKFEHEITSFRGGQGLDRSTYLDAILHTHTHFRMVATFYETVRMSI